MCALLSHLETTLIGMARYNVLVHHALIHFRLTFINANTLLAGLNCSRHVEKMYCAEVSFETDNCLHPGSLGGMCCGKRLEEECGVAFSYTYKVYLFRDHQQVLVES